MVPDSPLPNRPRHLAAVWMADVVGFSHLASSNEDRALELIERFQAAVHTAVERHGGRLVKFIGDAALAEFSATAGAVRAAADLRVIVPEELRLRVGIHVGDVMIAEDGDILGDGVNLAARLQTAAAPGQILVSEQAWHQLRHREGFSFVPAGLRQLKGQTERLRIWEVIASPSDEALEGASEGQRQRGVVTSRPTRHALHPSSLLAKLQHSAHRGGISLTLVGVVVVLVLGVGLWWASGIGRIERGERLAMLAEEGPAPTRLAVLYFDDHSPGGQLGYLADGLTEALIHELSQVDALEVISRNGVKPFRDAAVPIDSIVRALEVGSLVEGSVAEAGGRVRVTVQLIDGSTGTHLESRVVEEESDDLFALQDRVVEEVAGVLRQSLGREVRLRELRHGTESEEAYELVLRARELREDFLSQQSTPGSTATRVLLSADSLLGLAMDLDPEWVEPIVARGWINHYLAAQNGDIPGQVDAETERRAIALADAALALDGNSAPAYGLRGTALRALATISRGQEAARLTQAAERDLLRSTQIDPGLAPSWAVLSELYVDQARFSEANRTARRALEADAFLENGALILGQVYYSAVQNGPNQEAVQTCEEGGRRYPRSEDFILCKLFILASFSSVPPDVELGLEMADSLAGVVRPENRQAFTAYGRMLVAQIAARAGMVDSARALIRSARQGNPPDWIAYNEAHARMLMGEQEEAAALLSEYLDYRPADSTLVANDWWFSSLADHPDFPAP